MSQTLEMLEVTKDQISEVGQVRFQIGRIFDVFCVLVFGYDKKKVDHNVDSKIGIKTTTITKTYTLLFDKTHCWNGWPTKPKS